MPNTYRIKFTIDQEAAFEECNGEARPLTAAEYAENEYRACPHHPRAGTQVIEFGPPQIQGCATCGNTAYAPVSYAEYLAYYGNPDRHVYLGIVVDRQCTCCDAWKTVSSLWNVDFMDDSAELAAVTIDRWMDEATARALPGYAGELVREQLSDCEER